MQGKLLAALALPRRTASRSVASVTSRSERCFASQAPRERHAPRFRASVRTFCGAVLLLCLALLLPACANLKLTREQCTEYCAKRGKSVRSFEVGAAVPVINPKPAVDCECEVSGP